MTQLYAKRFISAPCLTLFSIAEHLLRNICKILMCHLPHRLYSWCNRTIRLFCLVWNRKWYCYKMTAGSCCACAKENIYFCEEKANLTTYAIKLPFSMHTRATHSENDTINNHFLLWINEYEYYRVLILSAVHTLSHVLAHWLIGPE